MSVPLDYPDLSVARRAQLVIAGFALFTQMDINVVSLLLEAIKNDLHISDVQVGLANSSALYVGYALFSIPMGLLVDRLTRTRLLMIAAGMWCSGLLLTGASSSFAMLVTSKFILGVANALTGPASMSLLADYFVPDRRGQAMGSYGIGQEFGGAAAIIIGGLGLGYLTKLSMIQPGILHGIAPWRCVSLVFALCGIAIIPFLARMREPQRQERGEGGGPVTAALWKFRGYLIPLVGVQAFERGAFNGFTNWIPTALHRIYGLSSSDFAFWYSALSLASGIGGIWLAVTVVPIWLKKGLLLPMGVGAAVLFGLASTIALMPNVIMFGICFVLLVLAASMASAITLLSIAYRMPNELRGAAIAISAVAVSITGAVGAPLMAWVSDLRGGGAMIGQGMAIVGVAGGFLSILALLSLPKHGPGAAEGTA